MPGQERDDVGGSFLRRAGPLVFARMIGAGFTFIIPLVLARAMALEEYGTYKQIFLISQTLQYTLPFGVAQSLYFFIPRAEQPRPWVAQTLSFLVLAGLLGATLVYTLGDGVAAILDNPGLLQFRGELALYVFGLVAASAFEISFTGQGKTKVAAVIYLVTDLLRACAMVVPVLLGYGLAGAMAATVGLTLLRAVVAWVTLITTTKGPLFVPAHLRTQMAYAAPFGAAMLLNVPQQYAHQYAVGAVVPPELFAIYAVGCFQLPLVDLLYTPTSEVLMVRVGELERQGRVRESVHAFREAAGRLAYFFLPTAAFLFVAAPEFIGALFGAKFLPAVPIFRVSVLAIALSTLPMDGLLRARNETRWIFKSYLIKALVTVPLLWVGVTWFGMLGGICAWASAEIIGKVTLLVRVPRALEHREGSLLVRIGRVLPWPALSRAALAAVGAGVAVGVLREATPAVFAELPRGDLWRALPLATVAVLFGVGYLVLLRVAGVRPLSVLATLRRRPS